RTPMDSVMPVPASMRLPVIVASPPLITFTPYELFTAGAFWIVRLFSTAFLAPSTVTAEVVFERNRSTRKPSSAVLLTTVAGNVTPSGVCGWIVVVMVAQRVHGEPTGL